jgi:ABC-type sugar transport system substrate-binding protein
MQRYRRTLWLAAAGAVLVALAGCASAGGSSAPPTTAASAGFSATRVSSLAAPFSTRPTTIPVTTPLAKLPPRDKVIDYLQCPIPDCTSLTPFVQQAASYFGWTLHVINQGLTPATQLAAFQQAVKDKPGAVWATAVPRAEVNPEIAELKSMGIPYVELTETDPPGNGIIGDVVPNAVFQELGEVTAYAALQAGGSDLHALEVRIAGFPEPLTSSTAFGQTILSLCSSCTVATLTFDATQMGTPAIPDGIVAYLKGHPSINAVACPFYEIIQALVPQLPSAGLSSVKTYTDDEGPIYNDVKSGKITAAIASPWVEWLYMTIDMLARYFTNQPLTPDTQNPADTHFWILTKNNIPAEAAQTYFPLDANAFTNFTQLWKVS